MRGASLPGCVGVPVWRQHWHRSQPGLAVRRRGRVRRPAGWRGAAARCAGVRAAPATGRALPRAARPGGRRLHRSTGWLAVPVARWHGRFLAHVAGPASWLGPAAAGPASWPAAGLWRRRPGCRLAVCWAGRLAGCLGPRRWGWLVSRQRSSVGLRWPSNRIAALHRLPIRSVLAAQCALRCDPMAMRSLRHLSADATLAQTRRAAQHDAPRLARPAPGHPGLKGMWIEA